MKANFISGVVFKLTIDAKYGDVYDYIEVTYPDEYFAHKLTKAEALSMMQAEAEALFHKWSDRILKNIEVVDLPN